MDSRPAKRSRSSRQGSSYRYSVLDPATEYRDVHTREARRVKVGVSQTRTVPTPRVVERSREDWLAAASWLPPDDLMYALCADEVPYNEAVEGPVITDDTPTKPPKKAKSSLSVSFLKFSSL